MAAETRRSVDELLAVMVNHDGLHRVLAFGEAVRANLGGVTVADWCCGRKPDEPLLLTLTGLFDHLRRHDNAAAVRVRGHRMHTTVNVTLYDPDSDSGRGPALGRGPA